MKFHPVLILGGLSLLAFLGTAFSGLDYDSGGFQTTAFSVEYILSFPFRFVGYLLTWINSGHASRIQLFPTIAIGGLLFYLLDLALVSMSKARAKQ